MNTPHSRAADSLMEFERQVLQQAIDILKRRASESTTYTVEGALLEAAEEIDALARKGNE